MIVEGLGPAQRVAMSQALRAGDPIRLKLPKSIPFETRLDEIAPLCYAFEAENPLDLQTLQTWAAPPAARGSGLKVTAIVPCHRGPPLGAAALFRQDVEVRLRVLSNGPEGPNRVPGAELLQVGWEGHGRTRQRGLDGVTDPYVFFTVDDAMPLGAGLLRVLVEALEQGGYDAVVARQVPWPDADLVSRERLRDWTPPGTRVVPFAQTDNVGTLYRLSSLRQHPLPDVPIAEDAWWSRGRRVGYVPYAPVLHSHTRSAGTLYRRNRDIHRELVRMGQEPAVPSLPALVGALPGVVRPTLIGPRGELKNQLAELAGQWVGAWKGRRG